MAGAYTGTYGGSGVGITEGFELQQNAEVENIGETDQYGGSVIDQIYRGGNCFLQFESKAYKAGSIAAFWPYGTLGTGGTVGRLASALAQAHVLTAVGGTPAASSPGSLTGTLSILAENNPARLLFHSKLRTVPVRLRVLFGGTSWFT